MKVIFENLSNLTLTLTSAPSVRFSPDESGINQCVRCFMSMTGGTLSAVTDDNPLTGKVIWKSDDDMLMDEYVVENFLRYEISNVEADEEAGINASCTLLLTNDPVPEPAPEPEPPTPEELLARAKAGRDTAITSARDATIAAGVDVTTSYGLEHFTLSEKDKTLLLGIYGIVNSGQINSWPYHSINLESRSTNICTIYTQEDITKIAVAVFGFITYHETYANMLLQWLNRETDVDTVYTIEYGAALPEDLNSYMNMLLTSSGIDPSLFTGGSTEDEEETPGDASTESGTDTGEETTEPTT